MMEKQKSLKSIKTTTHFSKQGEKMGKRSHQVDGLHVEKHSCKVHIVHLSSSDILPYLKEKKEKNPLLTVETCPHYLVLASEKIPPEENFVQMLPPYPRRNK